MIGGSLIGMTMNGHSMSVSGVIRSVTTAIGAVKRTASSEASDLEAKWATDTQSTNADATIAIYDKKTGVTATYTTSGRSQFKTASVVKVAVLSNLIAQHTSDQTNMSINEKTLATAMIEDSDNDATTALLEDEGGYKAPDKLFNKLGMADSAMDESAWGYSLTTASDQVTLLRNIFYDSSVLPDAGQSYIADLMSNVASSQNWGVSAGVGSDATVSLKNGWLEDSNGWIINSIGHVKSNNSDYVIAVLTSGNTSEQAGIALVEKLAKTTYAYLNN
ncbi:class A beta-lactamase-related serine hydrolase [Weissella confusa]|uniref:class A beta-lactamase-related serine hydrolase n=1 Tax=Weissella confusa TaxID=1583 RepID=UPI00223A7766|nr:class A beta-lactamase-related serine hydrolase [Weissella confusa]